MKTWIIRLAIAVGLFALRRDAGAQTTRGIGQSIPASPIICRSFPVRLREGTSILATNLTVSTVGSRSLLATPSIVRLADGAPENAPGTLAGVLEVAGQEATIETVLRVEGHGRSQLHAESYPRLVFAGERIVGMLYSARLSDDSFETVRRESALMFVPYERSQWMTPVELARAKNFEWQPNFVGIAQRNGVTWVVVPMDETSGVRSLLLLTHESGRWRKGRIDPGGLPSTADVSFDRQGSPLVALTAVDVRSRETNGFQAWLARIDPVSLRTKGIERLAWSGRGSAAWVRFAHPEGLTKPSAFVVWGHQSAGHGGRDSIRFVRTTDDWQTFVSGEGIPMREDLFSLDAKIDELGRIVVLAQTISSNSRTYALDVVRLDKNGRRSITSIAADDAFSLGHLAWVRNQMSAVWLGTAHARAEKRFTHLRYTVLSGCE